MGFTGASRLNMVSPAGSASVTCITLKEERVLAFLDKLFGKVSGPLSYLLDSWSMFLFIRSHLNPMFNFFSKIITLDNCEVQVQVSYLQFLTF